MVSQALRSERAGIGLADATHGHRCCGGCQGKDSPTGSKPTFLAPRHCCSWGLVRTPYWQLWGCHVISLQSQVLLSEQLRQGMIHWPGTDTKTSFGSVSTDEITVCKEPWGSAVAHPPRSCGEKTTLAIQIEWSNAWPLSNQIESHCIMIWNSTVHAEIKSEFSSVKPRTCTKSSDQALLN